MSAIRGQASAGRHDRRHVGSSDERERLAPEVFRLPVEKIRDAYYSDTYFALTKELLEAEGRRPQVTMQVFAKRRGLLGGIDEAVAILRALCRAAP